MRETIIFTLQMIVSGMLVTPLRFHLQHFTQWMVMFGMMRLLFQGRRLKLEQ